MKKKIIVLFALLTVVLLLFAACDGTPGVSDLQKYNTMLKAKYSTIQVLIKTKTATAELDGKFTLTFNGDETSIDYEFDRINTFDMEGGNIADPEDGFIVHEKGTVVVRNGEILDGDESVELPLDEISISGYSFKQAFFSNANIKNAKFEADVSNPQKFTGNEALDCTNMHVVVLRNVNTNTLTRMDVTYTAKNGAEVELNYLFTK